MPNKKLTMKKSRSAKREAKHEAKREAKHEAKREAKHEAKREAARAFSFKFTFHVYICYFCLALYFRFMFNLYASALHFRLLFHIYMSGSYFWFRFMIWMSGFWRLLSVSWGGTTMKTKKKFLAEPFFRVVAILFVRFWGGRNSFRGTICAAKLWGNAEGRQAVSAFKLLYKNPSR